MTKLRARNLNVLVLPDESARMKGKLYLPESSIKIPTRGTVVEVGPGYVQPDGSRLPLDIEPGMRVEFRLDPGVPVSAVALDIDGEMHFSLREDQILYEVTEEPIPEMVGPQEGEPDPALADPPATPQLDAELTPAPSRIAIASR